MPDNNHNRMSDDDRDQFDKFYREEHDKIMEAENEKSFLKDKSIGGDALRPSDEFIDQNLGKQKTNAEIHQETMASAQERFDQWSADEQQKDKVQVQQAADRAQRPDAKTEFQKKARPKSREIFRKRRENSQKKGRGR